MGFPQPITVTLFVFGFFKLPQLLVRHRPRARFTYLHPPTIGLISYGHSNPSTISRVEYIPCAFTMTGPSARRLVTNSVAIFPTHDLFPEVWVTPRSSLIFQDTPCARNCAAATRYRLRSLTFGIT